MLCVVCLRGPVKDVPAVTICEGNAVCRKHVSYVRVSDDLLRAIDRAYKERA